MATDRTGATGFVGFLIPQQLTEADIVAADSTYALKDPVAGAPTTSADTSLAIEVIGSMSSSTAVLQAAVASAGLPAGGRQKSGGLRYRNAASGAWYGADDPAVRTDYIAITESVSKPGGGSCGSTSAVAFPDGQVAVMHHASTTSILCKYRTATGAYSSSSIALVASGGTGCLCLGPDGSLHAYVLDDTVSIYRSTDYGATWTRQTSDCLGASVAGEYVRAERDGAGRVILFVTDELGTANLVCKQYVSTDGGYRFTLVATTQDVVVWDVRNIEGRLVAVTGEDSDDIRTRAIGSATTDLFSGSYTLVTTSAGADATDWSGGAICGTPWGTWFLYLPDTTSQGYYSIDGGASWTSSSPPKLAPTPPLASTREPGDPSMVWTRGGVSLFCNAAGRTDSDTAAVLVEYRFGGHTNWPVTADMQSANRAWRINAWSFEATPMATLAGFGVTILETGTVTKTHSYTTGTRVQTAAGAGNDGSYSKDSLSTVDGHANAVVRLRPVTGTIVVRLAGPAMIVRAEVNATQIRFYDESGSASSFSNHGIDVAGGAYIEIGMSLQGYVSPSAVLTQDASCVYRGVTNGTISQERAFTVLAADTTIGASIGTKWQIIIEVPHTSDVYLHTINFYHALSADASALSTTGMLATTSTAWDVCGAHLSAAYNWLTGSLSARSALGVPRVDGVTHSWAAVSDGYPVRNLFPARSPSPDRRWKSSGTTSATFKLTLDPIPGALFGVYLGGLYDLSSVALTFNATAGPSVATYYAYEYDKVGTYMVRSDAGADGSTVRWVRRGELIGRRFRDSASVLHTIVDNTEGSLTPEQDTHKRAVLTLATEPAASGAGRLYLPELLLAVHSGSIDEVQTITLAMTGASSDFEVGIVAVGAIDVVPAYHDYDTVLIRDTAAQIVTQSDGTRSTRRRHRDRRRSQFSWTASSHGIRGAGLRTADYVTINTGSGHGPIATWEALPLIIEGVVDRAGGRPVVGPFALSAQTSASVVETIDPGTGAHVDTMYGRIVDGFRRDAVPFTGPHGTSQFWRVPTLTIEEEL